MIKGDVTPPRAGLEIPGPQPRRAGLDLTGIAEHPKPRVDAAAISEVARATGFTSRQSESAQQETDLPPPRRRMKRAAPKVQFNGRVPPDVLRRIVRYCNDERLENGEFLERAIDALAPL